MIKLNCVGDICPVPVIKTKQALQSAMGDFSGLEIIVDNEIAVQNISKYLTAQDCEFSASKSGSNFAISVTKIATPTEEVPSVDGYIVAVSSNTMGSGDDALGKQLLKGFIFALTQAENLPVAVVFYNSGIELCLQGAETAQDLLGLAQNGVQVLSCGLCLNHYQALDKLAVGEVTDMYNIVNLMQGHKVVRP